MQANLILIKRTMLSLLKFALVGASGLVIDFSITWLFRDVLSINEYVASSCGFVMAATSNYYLNSKWTFRSSLGASQSYGASGQSSAGTRQFMLFFCISVVGLGLHMLLLRLFQGLHLSFYIAKGLAIGCVLVWNFTANSLITFRARRMDRVAPGAPSLSGASSLSGVKASTLVLLLGVILLLTGCGDRGPAASSVETTLKLDSSLGIGKNIQFFPLPGRIVALNPDSANRVLIVGKDGKVLKTIYDTAYSATESTGRLHLVNKVAVDSSSMEIFIYSPLERHILVYDTVGNYKRSIPIQRVHNGSFNRIQGKFVFLDKIDGAKKDSTKLYVVDSAGADVDGL